MSVPQKLNIELLFDSQILLLDVYTKELKAGNQTNLFIAALFTMQKGRNNPNVCGQMNG